MYSQWSDAQVTYSESTVARGSAQWAIRAQKMHRHCPRAIESRTEQLVWLELSEMGDVRTMRAVAP